MYGGSLAAAFVLTACSSDSPSTLTPAGPAAARVAGLWWLMFGISAAVVIFVSALILVGAFGRGRRDRDRAEPRWATTLIVGGGIVFPILVLAVVWALTLRDVSDLASPPGDPTVRIEVEGLRWWWDVRYPELGVVTANEIHIPVGEVVEVELTSGDIIHSFWVPELTTKMDTIPGRTNEMWLVADRAGTYRGQCAEYCGLQHAYMAFLVIAEPREAFDRWVAGQQADAAVPADPLAQDGQEVFLESACVGCHTIRGTEARGTLGPDLTHLASRRTLGAGTIPNTESNLGAWVPNAQEFKPGALMPPVPLSSEELEAVVAFLESLE